MPNYEAHLNSSDSRFSAIDTPEKLGKDIATKYPKDVDAVLRAMPSGEKQALIRAAVREKLVRLDLI